MVGRIFALRQRGVADHAGKHDGGKLAAFRAFVRLDLSLSQSLANTETRIGSGQGRKGREAA